MSVPRNAYHLNRTPQGTTVTVRIPKGDGQHREYELPLWDEVVNHSPTGFEWGYAGSGPAQLAVAILMDVYGSPVIALTFEYIVRRDIIEDLDGDHHSIHERDVREVVERQVAGNPAQFIERFAQTDQGLAREKARQKAGGVPKDG